MYPKFISVNLNSYQNPDFLKNHVKLIKHPYYHNNILRIVSFQEKIIFVVIFSITIEQTNILELFSKKNIHMLSSSFNHRRRVPICLSMNRSNNPFCSYLHQDNRLNNIYHKGILCIWKKKRKNLTKNILL